jgi:hypothetical protein
MNNTEGAPGEDLRQQAAKETATAIARMKSSAASVDGSDIDSAIKHIAQAVQVPPPPPNEVPAIRYHYLRPRPPVVKVSRPGLLRRVLEWFGR